LSFVNGKYDYDGALTWQGYYKTGGEIRYVRNIPAGEGKEQGGAGRRKKKLTLFRCLMRSHEKWWFISEANEEQPGTDRDIDYYHHKCKERDEPVPPCRGWTTFRAVGIDPPPQLEAQGNMLPPVRTAGEEPKHHHFGAFTRRVGNRQ
jgi:hypothetical protein